MWRGASQPAAVSWEMLKRKTNFTITHRHTAIASAALKDMKGVVSGHKCTSNVVPIWGAIYAGWCIGHFRSHERRARPRRRRWGCAVRSVGSGGCPCPMRSCRDFRRDRVFEAAPFGISGASLGGAVCRRAIHERISHTSTLRYISYKSTCNNSDH